MPYTEFAPPEKEITEKLIELNKHLSHNLVIKIILESFPDIVLILNKFRQIVLFNENLLKFLNLEDGKGLIGNRPGEALKCIYGSESEGGCGTTKFCKHCGAVKAIMNSMKYMKKDTQECTVTVKNEKVMNAFNFFVTATPLNLNNDIYTIFAIKDISDEKYLYILERMFFHDILNLAGGIYNFMELSSIMPDENKGDYLDRSLKYLKQLINEIQNQRDIFSAERGDYNIMTEEIYIPDFLSELCELYNKHSLSEDKSISFSYSGNPFINTDRNLLFRIIGNLIKNAFEASRPGEKVTVIYEHNGEPTFKVHNITAMNDDVKLQVFKRAFSTKEGRGRGIGTYSVKLLTEHYLKGQVAFTSNESEGTTFTVKLGS